jgi:glycosyltransferase involved in cell wall biosynthesis
MKIAFFGSCTHPNGVSWMEDLAGLLDLEVHAVDYDTPRTPIRHIAAHHHIRAPENRTRYLTTARRVRQVVERIQPDLLLAYRVVSYGYTAARTGIHPLVLAGQGQWIVHPDSFAGFRWLARHALRQADLIHAWAEHMAKAMRGLGADPARIRVLHRGVRTDIFHPGANADRPPRIITSRQLDSYYRTDLVIRALARLARRGSPAELWIAGDGPQRQSLERLVTDLDLSGRVRFLGRLPLPELAEAYRQSSVYAAMVPSDGVSSSLLESMASGLYPVVVDNDANRDWIENGHNGSLVPPGDLDALVRAIENAVGDEGGGAETAQVNRERVVARADRRTNLELIVGWWRDLTGVVDDARAAGL